MLLEGKKVAIFNVANKRSIAWAIARAVDREGGNVILGYQNERTKGNVKALAQELTKPPLALVQCDVTSDEDLDNVGKVVKEKAQTLDGLVHCLAFAPRQTLEKPYIATEREDFKTAMDISAYSLVALSRTVEPMLATDSSIITLSYLGAERVVPNYNVMGVAKAALEASVRYLAHDLGSRGIRVNAISAGPVNTLAARGVSGFVDMLDIHGERAALKRNIEVDEVGDTAVFLASKLSSGITGETIYVDTGYHMMGM